MCWATLGAAVYMYRRLPRCSLIRIARMSANAKTMRTTNWCEGEFVVAAERRPRLRDFAAGPDCRVAAGSARTRPLLPWARTPDANLLRAARRQTARPWARWSAGYDASPLADQESRSVISVSSLVSARAADNLASSSWRSSGMRSIPREWVLRSAPPAPVKKLFRASVAQRHARNERIGKRPPTISN